METPITEDSDFIIWILLIQVRDLIFKSRQKELSQYGITGTESAAMTIIKTIGDKATPAEISRRIMREHHSVTALLKRMEKRDLITRTKNPARKNTWMIRLTEKGENAFRESLKMEIIHEALSVLSEEEQRQFESYLWKLRDQALKLSLQIPPTPFP